MPENMLGSHLCFEAYCWDVRLAQDSSRGCCCRASACHPAATIPAAVCPVICLTPNTPGMPTADDKRLESPGRWQSRWADLADSMILQRATSVRPSKSSCAFAEELGRVRTSLCCQENATTAPRRCTLPRNRMGSNTYTYIHTHTYYIYVYIYIQIHTPYVLLFTYSIYIYVYTRSYVHVCICICIIGECMITSTNVNMYNYTHVSYM